MLVSTVVATKDEIVTIPAREGEAPHAATFISPDIEGLNTPIKCAVWNRLNGPPVHYIQVLAFFVAGDRQVHFDWLPVRRFSRPETDRVWSAVVVRN